MSQVHASHPPMRPGRPSPVRRDVGDASVAVPAPATTAEVAALFRVLSDPTRIRLIALLATHAQTVGALAHAVGMTESAVSHQLRVLKDAGIVRGRPDGRQVFYALDDVHVLTLYQQALSHVAERTGAGTGVP